MKKSHPWLAATCCYLLLRFFRYMAYLPPMIYAAADVGLALYPLMIVMELAFGFAGHFLSFVVFCRLRQEHYGSAVDKAHILLLVAVCFSTVFLAVEYLNEIYDLFTPFYCLAALLSVFFRNRWRKAMTKKEIDEISRAGDDSEKIFHEPGQYGTKTLTTPVMAANSKWNITADDLTETSGSLPSAESEPEPEPETVPTPDPEPEPFLCGMPFIWQEQREQKAAELAAATGIENGPELLKVLLIMEEEKDMELEQERSKRWLALKHEKRKLRHARVAAILCAVLLCACVGLGTAGIATGYVELGNHHDTEWNTMRNTQINIRKEITKTAYEKVYVGMSWRKFCIVTAMPNAMITHSFNKVYVVGESGTYFFYFKDGKLASKERK